MTRSKLRNDRHLTLDQLLSRIEAGDSQVARAAMEEHCDGTAALLRGLLS